jgi:hypothetical protein
LLINPSRWQRKTLPRRSWGSSRYRQMRMRSKQPSSRTLSVVVNWPDYRIADLNFQPLCNRLFFVQTALIPLGPNAVLHPTPALHNLLRCTFPPHSGRLLRRHFPYPAHRTHWFKEEVKLTQTAKTPMGIMYRLFLNAQDAVRRPVRSNLQIRTSCGKVT